jgi:Zn finger protein HypA/HybF involved in hydrogenase expression
MNSPFTNPGDVNRNGQILVRKTSLAGTDHNAKIWVLKCGNYECGHEYGSNSTDAWERKCPECGGGKPGLAMDETKPLS